MGPLRGPFLAHTADDPPPFSLLPPHDIRCVVYSFGEQKLPPDTSPASAASH